MSYTPKPGDRVTSPLLVGEWEVIGDESSHHPMAYRVKVGNETREARVWVTDLAPVAPPIPTEPPIGSVVPMKDPYRNQYTPKPDDLTPVAPPIPTEPAIGSVVRAHGRLWLRLLDYWMDSDGNDRVWPDVADAPDLSPVVAMDDAIEWLDTAIQDSNPGVRAPTWLSRAFRYEFGWWTS